MHAMDSPSACDVPAVRCSISEARVTPPLDAVVGWQLAAPLGLVELERQAQHLTIVVAACRGAEGVGQGGRQGGRQEGGRAREQAGRREQDVSVGILPGNARLHCGTCN